MYFMQRIRTRGFCSLQPEQKVKVRKNKSKGYWNEKENVIKLLNEIKLIYNLNTPQDWNTLTQSIICSHGGSSLLHNYSIYELKCLGCPEGKSFFTSPIIAKSNGYWKKKENVKKFMIELGKNYNLSTPEDWNSITKYHILSQGGSSLLLHYSMFKLKCIACPEVEIKFSNHPKNNYKSPGYWNNIENVLQFLDKLKIDLNLKTPENWNKITQQQIHFYGGGSLLSTYSVFEIKCLGCPEVKSKFSNQAKNKPKKPGYWEIFDNVQNFINELRDIYQLSTIDDWNKLSQKHIQKNGGITLLRKYSMYELKCIGCPEGSSHFSKFSKHKPPGFWKNKENVKNFIENLQQNLNVNSIDDWKRVSRSQITNHGGRGLLHEMSKNDFIRTYSHSNELIFDKKVRSSQRWLFLQVQKLFPDEEIVEDYFHSEISRESGFPVQFDIYLVNRNIAIEYHGKQHYEDIPSAGFASLEMYQNRDYEKEKLCSKYNLKLIVIPYWWNNELDSLKNTINLKINEKIK